MTAEGPYRVTYLGPARASLLAAISQAGPAGLIAKCGTALKNIEERLRTEPSELGEIIGRLPLSKLDLYVGSVPPLTVRFAIHQEVPEIFVHKFFFRPKSL
jgi:hypothetical protein